VQVAESLIALAPPLALALARKNKTHIEYVTQPWSIVYETLCTNVALPLCCMHAMVA